MCRQRHGELARPTPEVQDPGVPVDAEPIDEGVDDCVAVVRSVLGVVRLGAVEPGGVIGGHGSRTLTRDRKNVGGVHRHRSAWSLAGDEPATSVRSPPLKPPGDNGHA